MEMTAEVMYDAKALRTLYLTKIISLGSPYVSIAGSVFLAIFFFLLGIAMLILEIASPALLGLCIGIGVLLLIYDLLIFVISPRSIVKARQKNGYGPVCFVFGETAFSTSVVGNGMTEHIDREYNAILKLVETNEYLFFYIEQNNAYILKKDCLKGGTAEELRLRITGCPNVRYQRKNF